MNRVFLVPEHSRDLVLTAPGQNVLQFLAVVANFAAPQVILAAPGGLDEQQFWAEAFDFHFPVGWREWHQVAFVAVRAEGELIHHARHFQAADGLVGLAQQGSAALLAGCQGSWQLEVVLVLHHRWRRQQCLERFVGQQFLLVLLALLVGLAVQPQQAHRQLDQAAQGAGAVLDLVAELVGHAGTRLDQALFSQVTLGVGSAQVFVELVDLALLS
ncbi:hypothetical protein D3C79_725610 [compost metagenome]